jgi:hypothetical protein
MLNSGGDRRRIPHRQLQGASEENGLMSVGTIRGGIIGGVILVAFGVMLLAGTVAGLNPWAFIWPYFIIVPGLLCLAGAFTRGAAGAALAIAGSMLTTIGFILFYQNVFGYFQSWAYAWLLVCPTAIGVGLLLHGRVTQQRGKMQLGLRLAGLGLTLFLLVGICFEVAVFAHGSLIRFGGPALLIVLGLSLAIGSLARLSTRQAIDSY